MDTIVTPVTVITLDSTRIVHSIKADLVARYFPPVVRLVQYDMSLPVIAVSLMQNGQTYTLPSGAAANIRVHKPDATYVYNPALGCDSTRNIVYFEVTQAMAAANGDGLAIVEIVVDGDIAGTSLITLHFEENPVPEDAIESSDEWETIYELGERIIASTVTPVSTAAGMTDHNVVYLYTGTESGWNQGHMYYYNGTAWVDAGIAVTDTTLSVAGLAADAKATGDEIATVKDGLFAAFVTDTASGAIASFPDGADDVPVKSLTVGVDPAQNLNGYANPWVGGTGKNKFKMRSVTKTTNGITVTANADGTVTLSGTATAGSATSMCDDTDLLTDIIASGGTFTMSLNKGTYDSNTLNISIAYKETASGSVKYIRPNNTVTIPQGAIFSSANLWVPSGSTVQALDHFGIQLEEGSSASAYSPYTNTCPISGRTQVNVTHLGVNMFVTPSTGTSAGITYTKNDNGTFTVNGTATAYSFREVTGTLIEGDYVLSGGGNGVNLHVRNSANDSVIAISNASNPVVNFSITEQTNAKYRLQVADGTTVNNLVVYPKLYFISDTDAFEPYYGKTYTIDLNGTRYGGTLDVTSGVLTVDRALITIDGNTTVFQAKGSRTDSDEYYITLNDGYLFGGTARYVPTADGIAKGMICNVAPFKLPASTINEAEYTAYVGSGGTKLQLRFRLPLVLGIDTIAKANEFAENTNIQMIYPIATTFTVQLTANEVRTLLGRNSIFSDSGNVAAVYRADTKLYIDKVFGG